MSFFFEQILFFISILLTLFAPGYFLHLSIFGKSKDFHILEKIVIYLGLSFSSTTLLMLIMNKISIEFSKISILLSIIILCSIFFGIYKLRKNFFHSFKNKIFQSQKFLSKTNIVIIALLIFLSIFIKTSYLKETIFPTSTDLGHHMYWSKLISETGKIQSYQESELEEKEGSYQIGEPRKIADFIVGEHLIFSAISLLSGKNFISAFPSLILFLFNIFTPIAIFILALEAFKENEDKTNIATLSFLFAGPLYALSSPQAKFVSGGVIGNTFGNFLIPLILYFVIKSFKEKSSSKMSLAILISLGMAYTHHLSTFVFIFIVLFSIVFMLFYENFKILSKLKDWLRIFFKPSIFAVILFAFVMIFLIYTPTYLNTSAIDTAVGTPTKSTRTGLTFEQLRDSSGEARIVLGLIGIFILAYVSKFKGYGKYFIMGWSLSIFIMSLWPNLLLIDIPSNRIANYISFPFSLTAGLAISYLLSLFFSKSSNSKTGLKSEYISAVFLIFLIFSLMNGFSDNANSLSAGGNNQQAIQTFESSKYLSKFIQKSDIVLKDHNYLVADSWIKLFFMKDYNFPLSRAYFKRYEDETKQREQCTLLMISLPNSNEAEKCFAGTKTNFIMVSPKNDGTQFKKNKNFWNIYQSDEVSIFYKKN